MNGATGVVVPETQDLATLQSVRSDVRTPEASSAEQPAVGRLRAGIDRRQSPRRTPDRRQSSGERRSDSRQWIEGHRRVLVLGDLVAAGVGVLLAAFARDEPVNTSSHLVSFLVPVLWVIAMALADSYQPRIIGVGSEEYQRCFRGFVIVLAGVGFASYVLKAQVARSYVLIALPVAVLLSLVLRWVMRKRLHRVRTQGHALSMVVAVGDAESAAELATRMHAEAYLGMRVVGACIPREELSDPTAREVLRQAGIAPLGDLDSVVTAVSRSGADTVAITSSRQIGPRQLKVLSWQLERTDAELVVSPGLIEVAGPRLHIRPVTGLPLLHVEKPEFAGARRLVKGAFDRSAAILGLLVISPLLAVVWAAVRLTSPGPAFFTQTRVGKDGQEFRIWKFRSMYVDAEQRRAELAKSNVHGTGPLFKMHTDPRVTPLGRVIRRLSLDELPQLLNIANGTMSLVGPRPPLPSEVEQYGTHVRRRLLVRPGLTGLWQVSGRSDLSWEESVRLDLRYVENWSLGQDLLILWKTFSAVAKGSGAY